MTAKTGRQAEEFSFVFTETGFYPDVQADLSGEAAEWQKQFAQNRYETLYRMGFEERSSHPTPAGGFLRLLADTFLKLLTSMPELELVRENAQPDLSEEELDRLQNAVCDWGGIYHRELDSSYLPPAYGYICKRNSRV